MKVNELLDMYQLNATKYRIRVLNFFDKTSTAQSVSALLAQMPDINRITLYRTLKSFVEKGILFKIPSMDNNQWYVISRHLQEPKILKNNSYFICKMCHRTIPLDMNAVQNISLPVDCEIENVACVVNGKCAKCCSAAHEHLV